MASSVTIEGSYSTQTVPSTELTWAFLSPGTRWSLRWTRPGGATILKITVEGLLSAGPAFDVNPSTLAVDLVRSIYPQGIQKRQVCLFVMQTEQSGPLAIFTSVPCNWRPA